MHYTRTLNQGYYLDHTYERGHVYATQWIDTEVYSPFIENVHGLELLLAAQPIYLGLIVDGIDKTAKTRKHGHDIEVDTTDL